MATSWPSPTSPFASSPTSIVTPPPEPSPPPATTSPPPDPPTETNANPPDSSTISPPPPPVTSPPPASPPPLESPATSPLPAAISPPPDLATSPPPPTTNPPPPPVDPPPPSSPTFPETPTTTPPPPPPTTVTPPLPPPSSIPPSSPAADSPPVPSPPSDPPSSPPPPPTTKPKSPPYHSSPPPPASKSHPPKSQPPPPPMALSPYPPPPSTIPTRRPPSAPKSPKSSPYPPAQEPPSASPPKSGPSSPISPTVSHLSPPPVSSTTTGSLVPSSANLASANSTANSPSKGGVPVGGVVAIGVVVGVVMLGLIGLVVFYMCKRKRTSKHNGGYIVPSPYASSPRSDSNLIVKTVVSSSTPFVRSASGSGTLSPHSHGGLGQSRSWFTYQELYEATNGFGLEDLLGEGGFGSVYKGVLANGREVAVKQLKVGGSQGEREFQAEVEIISRIHHRHLVSLVGYCIYESKRLLVYEYVPNQTLYYNLHGENRPVMDWATRMKIAEGAARGIAYLHEDCHPRIIHRDIKSPNILLDNRFEARVADFGLAKLALDVETHVSTRVMGTFGYMAPEYATSGKLTDKSDVYSFGVVLLELLTGRKPVDASQPLGDESLVEWARPLLSHALETGQVKGLVDPRLEKDYVESELFLMIEAAAVCVRHSATKRPRMAQVVRAFDGLSPSDLSNGMRVGQSEIYDSAQQSAEIRWFRRMAFGCQDYSTDYISATRNMDQNNQRPIFSTQHSQKDPSQQQSQNIYFSSHRTQGPAFSGQWSQDFTVLRQSSQNPASQQQSSQNPTFLGQDNRNVDSSSRQSQSS